MCRYSALNMLQREITNASVKIPTMQQKARIWFHESGLIVTVQRCFRLEYRNYQSPSKNSIELWYQQFKGTGNVHHRKGAARPSVSDKVVERMRETFPP
ncbi:hypothetical protein AVEN_170308-1 [Araneus ventricosus]|uniref:DUF4817 domain-containing protein n=1 Tax=Araneus ventricosus TaxID=182803 RepID=A0A4Y2CAB5_ARAVE|nr:hypothetical protein AVEN_170308-1 [Araneus ventricosus]